MTGLLHKLRKMLHGVQRLGVSSDHHGPAQSRGPRHARLVYGLHLVPDGVPGSRLYQVRVRSAILSDHYTYDFRMLGRPNS